MFIILLKFADNKKQAPEFMQGHNDWIKLGLSDGVFLAIGSLKPNMGGAIVAHNLSREALQSRVENDPFVENNVVSAEILEISVNQTDERFNFLLD